MATNSVNSQDFRYKNEAIMGIEQDELGDYCSDEKDNSILFF